MLSSLFLAFILSLGEFLSEFVAMHLARVHRAVISFNAGLLLAFLFVYLLPDLLGLASSELVFVWLLAGFVVFHLCQQFVYRHSINSRAIRDERRWLVILGFYIAGLAEGLFLALSAAWLEQGVRLVVFVPLLLNSLNASLGIEQVLQCFCSGWGKRLALASGPLVGVLVGIGLSGFGFAIELFALVTGALLFVSVRDILPSEREEKPLSFLLGVLVMLLWLAIMGVL